MESSIVFGDTDTPVTGTTTVTAHVAVLRPSCVVAVIAAAPAATAFTTPVAVTVATPALLLDQATALFAASGGWTAADSAACAPTLRDSAALSSDTPETGTPLELGPPPPQDERASAASAGAKKRSGLGIESPQGAVHYSGCT
jgi:hypothetical protein